MGSRISCSNIAWPGEKDEEMYAYMREQGFSGIEIAPTRVFSDGPYERLDEARSFAAQLKEHYGLEISSMQSIWYGRSENIFGTDEDRRILAAYTKQAVDFASAAGCGNLVFGCPKNRAMPDGAETRTAYNFFAEIADYAAKRNTVIALEPNPVIYGTNFINTSSQAFELAQHINSSGFKVNIDCGTLIENGEGLELIRNNIELVNHIHLSEPNLVKIERREMHRELAALLREKNYNKFVSIEMKYPGNINIVKEIMRYTREIFG